MAWFDTLLELLLTQAGHSQARQETLASEKRAENRQIAAEQRQNEYNIAAEERALQYQKDLMDYQNDYNSEESQMQRLAKAGLNPYLMDGLNNSNSNGSPISADSVAAAASPTMDSRQSVSGVITSMMQRQLDYKRLVLENDKLNLEHKRHADDMSFREIQHTYQVHKDNADRAYNQIRDDLDRELKARSITNDEYKTRLAAARQEHDIALENAREYRENELHGLTVREKRFDIDIKGVQYNMDKLHFDFENDEQIRSARRSVVLIEKRLAQMDYRHRVKFEREILPKQFELMQKRMHNEITYEEYVKRMRENWRYHAGDDERLFFDIRNPYDPASDGGQGVLGFIESILTKKFVK